MNSKQINFYITPQDIIQVNNLLDEKSSVIFKGNTKELGSNLNYNLVLNPENIFQVYICNEEFKKKLFFEQMKLGEYYIDVMKSYVIEFGIGGFYPYSERNYIEVVSITYSNILTVTNW